MHGFNSLFAEVGFGNVSKGMTLWKTKKMYL